MRWSLATFGLFTFVLFAIGGDDASKADLKKMDGTWDATIHEKDGAKLPEDEVKKLASKVIIKDGGYTVVFGENKVASGKLKLNAGKKPKEIDAEDEGGKTLKGIYELDGDTMRVCFSEADRPTEFKTKEGSKSILIGYKRAK